MSNIEYLGQNKTEFKVPKVSPLRVCFNNLSKINFTNVKSGDTIAYSANDGKGNYPYGTTGFVSYAHPKGDYIVVLVETPVDNYFKLLQPAFDIVSTTPESLIELMKGI